jgi:hypothetical protein
MQLKIFINDKLYKTVEVKDEVYEPAFFIKQIEQEKQAGLLADFNINGPMKIEFRKK